MSAPYNMAEMAAIGLMLLYPQQAGEALGLLRAEMFEAQPLADIFRCIQRMHAEGRAWDGAAVAGALGPQYNELVMQCAECTGSAQQLGSYVAIVRRAWRERTLKAAALGLATGGQDADGITEAMRALVRRQDELLGEAGPGAAASFAQCAAAPGRPCRCRAGHAGAGLARLQPRHGRPCKKGRVCNCRAARAGQNRFCPANGRDAGGQVERVLFQHGDDGHAACAPRAFAGVQHPGGRPARRHAFARPGRGRTAGGGAL